MTKTRFPRSQPQALQTSNVSQARVWRNPRRISLNEFPGELAGDFLEDVDRDFLEDDFSWHSFTQKWGEKTGDPKKIQWLKTIHLRKIRSTKKPDPNFCGTHVGGLAGDFPGGFVGALFSCKDQKRPGSLLLSLGGAIQTFAWGRPGPIPGPKGVPSRFAMCFVLQRFRAIHHPAPELRWAKSPIANRYRSANVANSRKPFRSSTWNECQTNERQLHDSSLQHNERRVCEDEFLCFGGRYDRQRTLAIRIAAITLASDSAITMARFRPSKLPSVPSRIGPGRAETDFLATSIKMRRKESGSKIRGNTRQLKESRSMKFGSAENWSNAYLKKLLTRVSKPVPGGPRKEELG